jgi:hypothetical protein
MTRSRIAIAVVVSAIAAGAALAYFYKSRFRPIDPPRVQLALTDALREHIEAIELPLWPDAQVGLFDGRERLDGAIVVVGEIKAPLVGGLQRRSQVEAMFRRTCAHIEPACFRVVGLRVDGIVMPLAKPIIGGGL